MDEQDFSDDEIKPGAYFEMLPHPAFKARRRLRDTRVPHHRRGRWRQTRLVEFADVWRKMLAREMHRVRRVFVDKIDDELARAANVGERVFDRAVGMQAEAHDEKR